MLTLAHFINLRYIEQLLLLTKEGVSDWESVAQNVTLRDIEQLMLIAGEVVSELECVIT